MLNNCLSIISFPKLFWPVNARLKRTRESYFIARNSVGIYCLSQRSMARKTKRTSWWLVGGNCGLNFRFVSWTFGAKTNIPLSLSSLIFGQISKKQEEQAPWKKKQGRRRREKKKEQEKEERKARRNFCSCKYGKYSS